MAIFNCSVCGKKFSRLPSIYKKGSTACSLKCGHKRRKYLPNSGQFKKGFKPWNSGKKMSKAYKNKLSKARLKSIYRTGKNHPRWKYGSESYYMALSRKAMKDIGIKKNCFLCGSEKQIEVHHKDKDRRNISLVNLIYLCKSCHMIYHWRTDRRR